VIKIVAAGVWASVVALAASYFAVSWQGSQHTATEHAAPAPAGDGHGPAKGHGGTETVRTRMISVPVIRAGGVQGYVMAQFSFTADARSLKQLPVKADVVVIDEAFKAIYGEEAIDFRHLKKQDLPDLGKRIAEASNKRLGVRIVEDIFVQELNYVSKEGVRTGGGKHGGRSGAGAASSE
jgi:hypothetical protein